MKTIKPEDAKKALQGLMNLLESVGVEPSKESSKEIVEMDLSDLSGPDAIKLLQYDDKKDEDKDKKKKGIKRMEVKLIAEGWSKNGYYYSKEVAESVAHLINSQGRRKMYIDHQDMFFSTPSRKLKEFAAVIVEAYAKDGASYAIVESTGNPMTDWIFDFAERHPKEVGASIDARAKVKEVEEPEDDEKRSKEKWLVQELTFLNSVDFVSYASAGGEVVTALAQEALQIMESYVKQNQDLITNLSKGVSTQGTQKTQEDEENDKTKKTQTKKEESKMDKGQTTLTLESLKVEHPEILNNLREEIKKDVQASFNAEKETKELKEKLQNLETQVTTLESEKSDLQKKVDDFEVKETISKRRQRIDELITENDLPEAAVTKTFREDLEKFDKEEDIIERIKDRKKLVEASTGEVQGNGSRNTQESEGDGKESDKLTDDSIVEGIKS